MCCAGRSTGTIYPADPATHRGGKKIGPFSSPIRPCSVDRSETYFFACLTKLAGFGVGDVERGRVLYEVSHPTPAERSSHAEAFSGLPHGDRPLSHGIAVRPGSNEVWLLDDGWGYLYVFDASPLPAAPPRHVADVPLFDRIDEKVGPEHNRWVSFSIDGKYCYVPTRVLDSDTR